MAETPNKAAESGTTVNFVAGNRVLTEQVKAFAHRRKDLMFVFSAEPVFSGRIDGYVMPADTLHGYMTEIKELRLPVLAYGEPFFLKKAFVLGCNDYLKDPWTPEEMILRLQKVFQSIENKYSFPWGDLRIEGHLLFCGKQGVRLNFQECLILKVLLSGRNTVVDRQVLFGRIWGTLEEQSSRVADMHISRLRKKIGSILPDAMRDEEIIVSVRGKGYMIG